MASGDGRRYRSRPWKASSQKELPDRPTIKLPPDLASCPGLLEHHAGPMDVLLGTCYEISEGSCIACFDLCMYPRAARATRAAFHAFGVGKHGTV